MEDHPEQRSRADREKVGERIQPGERELALRNEESYHRAYDAHDGADAESEHEFSSALRLIELLLRDDNFVCVIAHFALTWIPRSFCVLRARQPVWLECSSAG